MVSPVSFQVGCRSYIPLVVYFAHNDVNSIWARTGNVLLYGPMSTVPRRYKNSGFFWMATCVAPFFASRKTWSVLGLMLDVSLWNNRLVHLCEILSFSVRQDDGSCGGKISLLTTLAWRRRRFFLIIAVWKELWGRKCSPTRFSCPSFSWAGLGVCLSSPLPQVSL